MTKKILIFIILAGLTACDKNPVRTLINPAQTNAIGVWDTTKDWVIYDDEMRTGGTVLMFTSLDNQELDFGSRDNPHSGSKCIKFSWNGKDVFQFGTPSGLEHDFVGFSLTASKDISTYLTDTRDISSGAYTKISFWARGNLNAFVFLRLEGNNGTSTTITPGTNAFMSSNLTPLSSNWQRYEFNISGSMTNIKDFVKIILKYDEGVTSNTSIGNGGTVFIDDIILTH